MHVGTMRARSRGVAYGSGQTGVNADARGLVGPFREAIDRYNLIGLGVTLLIGFATGTWAFLRLKPDFAARTKVERAVMGVLLIASLVAILTTLGIFVSLVFETVRFFGMVDPRSEEHTSELQSLMRTSYAVFCLKKNTRAY